MGRSPVASKHFQNKARRQWWSVHVEEWRRSGLSPVQILSRASAHGNDVQPLAEVDQRRANRAHRRGTSARAASFAASRRPRCAVQIEAVGRRSGVLGNACRSVSDAENFSPLKIQLAITALNLFAALSSALAAFFWYRASQVEGPSALMGTSGLSSAADPSGVDTLVDTGPLIEFARKTGRRNKIAALWSAAATSFGFLGWALGLFLPHA